MRAAIPGRLFSFLELVVAVLLQPEGEGDEERAEDDRIGADDPYKRQGAGARHEQHHETEEHRERARQDEPPLIVDLLADLDGADNLEDAVDQRPDANEHRQRKRGEARPQEGEEAGGDAKDTNEDQPPAGLHFSTAKRSANGEYAVDQGIGDVEDDQGQKRNARPGEGEEAEDDTGNAEQQ